MTNTAVSTLMCAGPTIYDAAVDLVRRQGKCSSTLIQRHLGIGDIITVQILDKLEREGIVGPAGKGGTREVLA